MKLWTPSKTCWMDRTKQEDRLSVNAAAARRLAEGQRSVSPQLHRTHTASRKSASDPVSRMTLLTSRALLGERSKPTEWVSMAEPLIRKLSKSWLKQVANWVMHMTRTATSSMTRNTSVRWTTPSLNHSKTVAKIMQQQQLLLDPDLTLKAGLVHIAQPRTSARRRVH